MKNEILHRRELKRVLKMGIPKHVAEEIVGYVLETTKNIENVEMYINYSIDLKFGIGASKRKTKNS